MSTVQDVMKQVDPAMLDALEGFVVAYMGHRRHETEDQTRAAVALGGPVADSYNRKITRAAVVLLSAGFDLRAQPSTPSSPAQQGGA